MIKSIFESNIFSSAVPLQQGCDEQPAQCGFWKQNFPKIRWRFCKEWEISMSWSVHFWEMSPKEQAVVGIAMELAGDDPEVQDNAAWCRFTLCHSHLDSSTWGYPQEGQYLWFGWNSVIKAFSSDSSSHCCSACSSDVHTSFHHDSQADTPSILHLHAPFRVTKMFWQP